MFYSGRLEVAIPGNTEFKFLLCCFLTARRKRQPHIPRKWSCILAELSIEHSCIMLSYECAVVCGGRWGLWSRLSGCRRRWQGFANGCTRHWMCNHRKDIRRRCVSTTIIALNSARQKVPATRWRGLDTQTVWEMRTGSLVCEHHCKCKWTMDDKSSGGV